MPVTERLSSLIPLAMAGMRLDQALAELFSGYSRARLQQWIRNGQVMVDARQWRPKDKVSGGERVEIVAALEEEVTSQPQPIPLTVVYEDEALLVINKSAGLVVHPAAGNPEGTMLNALLHHAPELIHVPRAGIVHRLDKDTSGLLVVARTLKAQAHLVEQLQERAFEREYEAVAVGVMTAGGRVDAPIGRHPVDRKRMAVTASGKEAVTHYRVAERFRAHTHVKVRLETGRTHQIRVHMAHIHYPLLGDPVYGGRLRIPRDSGAGLADTLRHFKRQALHAARLGLVHPESGERMGWQVPLPDDMAALLGILREDRMSHE
ncbi:MAG: 23S rRNA pseudouridine(1911/1915/1917) synthase RluD [Pseudomonadota bacterium]